MRIPHFSLLATTLMLLLAGSVLQAQVRLLDNFEAKTGWSFIQSDGVKVNLSVEPGMNGNALRFDYNFTNGTGYGGVQKLFPIDLPANYEFSFYLRADSPSNNFEIKFIDSTGHNVWWVNNRNYEFPGNWKKIRIRKRNIGFAWGPTADQNLTRVDRIEFTIASFLGGHGTIWLDDLKFEPLPPESQNYPPPAITATSSLPQHDPGMMTDGKEQTFWQSQVIRNQDVILNFKTSREMGGIQIDWQPGLEAKSFELFLSDDGKTWEKAYSVPSNHLDKSFVRLAETATKYLKINLQQAIKEKGFGIREIKIIPVTSSLTMNDFLIYVAKNSRPGDYPRYFSEQASFWTIAGVNNDVKEALINEDGMVEVEKARFSVEPMLKIGDSLYNWQNTKTSQSLGFSGKPNKFDFIPSVTWDCSGLELITSVRTSGEANVNSNLDLHYALKNTTSKPISFSLFLLIRPYQVNAYYQFLNLAGGAGKIDSIRMDNQRTLTIDGKTAVSQRPWSAFGTGTSDEGNVVEMVRTSKMLPGNSARDPRHQANAMIRYDFRLEPGATTGFFFVFPFHKSSPVDGVADTARLFTGLDTCSNFWKRKVSHISFNLPPSADRIINTYKANLVYILINRDHTGIQPGSRSYERSWIRDGALTSSALLKSGIVKEVKDFIDWYTAHQFENGKVPCVVDFRGPDPVPENDSHGEMIYLIREYFNFTHDTAFLKARNPGVLKAVDFIEKLIAEQTTDHFKSGNDSIRSCYGLVTESISHEGYSAKPMHSYWDDFFTMKGLKDAVEIQRILGEKDAYDRISKLRDSFRENLYNSINMTMKYKKIDYLPGCAELGDFDATSTTIALTPCNELKNLPKPQVYNTFDKYYRFFNDRRNGTLNWINYTPYENRLIGSFILLDQPGRAHELIDFFLHDQRPQGWDHWAEVVWKDYRTPKYIGDMPHTWVGSDFINAIRSMFVYENEYDQSLVVASALYQDWIDAANGMSVEHLPTYYGEISYAIKKDKDHYTFSISGDMKLPANGIQIRNFNGSKLPKRVTVNGKEISGFNDHEIPVTMVPAEVVIQY